MSDVRAAESGRVPQEAPPSAQSRDEEAQVRAAWLQQLLWQLAESAPVPFFALDASGAVLVWNAEAAKLFGWQVEEVVGRPVTDTILPAPFSVDRLGRQVPLSTGRDPVAGPTLMFRARRPTGESFPVRLDLWSTACGDRRTFSAYAYDVPPDDGEMRPALCAMGSLVESSGEAIIGTDIEGRILTWNAAAEHIFGYSSDEAVGQNISITVPADRQEELRSWTHELLSGAPVERQETVRRRADGSLLDVALTLSVVRNSEGRAVGLSTIARDISQERLMAAELESTLQGLEAALGDARESEARERHLLADVAHQLRAPITGIRSCAEALLRGGLPAGDERLLSGMVRETSRAARLITALLQMARLDDPANLAPAPCDIEALCEEEVSRARFLAPRLEFDLKVGQLKPARPELDADAVREIVANLLDNARRHANRRVEVALTAARGVVEMTVRDDGPGLPDGAEEQAFERFVTLDGKGGTGLGLPLARGLARAHDGDLVYGAKKFVLRLPTIAGGDPTGDSSRS